MNITPEQIRQSLSHIVHPEHHKDIVELGIVQDVRIENETITFALRPLAGNDPFGSSIARAAKRQIAKDFPGLQAQVHIERPEAPKHELPPRQGGPAQVKRIVAIASGKGGVGKSTITANLGVALTRKGYQVGILDADVFGPSMPLMLGVTDARPEMIQQTEEDLIIPVEAYGMKMLSMGFFVSPQEALVWRGPMASNALKQIMHMGLWKALDFLLIDLPPGTSDIHLSIVQELQLAGAVVVSTPQEIALADARKAIAMFSLENIAVPILGVVENMAWFEPEELPGHRYYIFGREGAKRLADEEKVPLLGQIPLIQGIREGGDAGCPIAAASSSLGSAFDALADQFIAQVEKLGPPVPADSQPPAKG